MIILEEAKELAQKARGNDIDYCHEYEDAFLFGNTMDPPSVGGKNHVPVVIIKENGQVMGLTAFVLGSKIERYRNLEEEVIARYVIHGEEIFSQT